ncbi:DUF1707 SHOCT-like domain-containing protein [Segniliparus rugosus]|uniref:Uncharacterized protein n=1 Tax=Segniliparus rugosus (strain ATCC BAA-974 / DSM 45345 / CCUG 50838 / CIP 108380 / JCM 13579 / CDC 945) TaxID=679197 RepID=E5XRH6_SEGRC|nr:DUF1707 domain-containing protein [Segniliparus rugosus]EFV13046.1 hypothetical protein HMPREF9336_02098 [Segniliparus rugosus ATCC BAA-974]
MANAQPERPGNGQQGSELQRRPNAADLFAPFRPDPPAYRASDADRDQVVRLLSQALSEGQLDVHEFDQRTKAVYAAKTHAELETVTCDLDVQAGVRRSGAIVGPSGRARTFLGVMGGFRRKGEWIVPRRVNVFVFWGGGVLDLRDAVFAEPEAVINIKALMGGATVIVPPELSVQVVGTGLMGSFADRASGAGDAGQPHVVIGGFAFWGGVNVVRSSGRNRALRAKLRRKNSRGV